MNVAYAKCGDFEKCENDVYVDMCDGALAPTESFKNLLIHANSGLSYEVRSVLDKYRQRVEHILSQSNHTETLLDQVQGGHTLVFVTYSGTPTVWTDIVLKAVEKFLHQRRAVAT